MTAILMLLQVHYTVGKIKCKTINCKTVLSLNRCHGKLLPYFCFRLLTFGNLRNLMKKITDIDYNRKKFQKLVSLIIS